MSPARSIGSVEEAESLLRELGAPARILRHAALVLEAGELLLQELRAHGVKLDEPLVRVGIVLHDAGKILHPGELVGGGTIHEEAGQAMLLARGVDPVVARCCVTHAQWASHDCSLEELVIALADALWKGARRAELEKRVIESVASLRDVDPWSIFVALDTCFEEIAGGGADRLSRSAVD